MPTMPASGQPGLDIEVAPVSEGDQAPRRTDLLDDAVTDDVVEGDGPAATCQEAPGARSTRSPVHRSPEGTVTDYETLLRKREEQFARDLAERDRRSAERDEAYRQALRERELALALASRPLVAGAAKQLVKLWRDEIDVYEEDGALRVATRDGRPVARAVTEWLGRPEYAHFCPPTSRGGTSSPNSGLLAAGGPVASTPRNLGEVAIQQWRESLPARGVGSPCPIGLLGRR